MNTSFSKEVKWTPSHKIMPGFLALSVANGKNRLNIGSHQTADKALSISAGWPDLHQHRWRYHTFSLKWNCLIIPQMGIVEIRFPDRFYRYSHDKLQQMLLLLFLLSLFNEGVTNKSDNEQLQSQTIKALLAYWDVKVLTSLSLHTLYW